MSQVASLKDLMAVQETELTLVGFAQDVVE
jgi:hypothetical protein